jgi:ABC-2 type transport system permease protein
MLWYKSWLETRWRFLIGLVLLICSALSTVFTYPQVLKLLPLVPAQLPANLGGEIGRRVREAVELARDFRGYVWSDWFRQNLPQTWTLFAVLIGTGGLLSHSAGGGTLFTLSMPVSRKRLLGVRTATGLIELFVLAFVPALFIPLFSPAIGQHYGVGSALVHSACLFIAGSVFFSLAALLSTLFQDVWRPLLIALGAAILLSLIEQASQVSFGIFHVMHGESYFRTGALPWAGLLASAALSVAMQYGAAVNIARRDF